jgi:sulfopyruvate decarboxylase subunit beta
MTGEYTQYECTEQVLEATPDAAVVANLGTSTFVLAAVEDRDLNYYMKGAMGVTTPLAHGMALHTDRHVVALEGDGSLLMSLGALATVGTNDPSNLTVVVMDNGMFTTTGGQTSLSPAVDFAAVAEGCSVDAYAATDAEEFDDAYGEAVESAHASVVVCDVTSTRPDEFAPIDYPHSFMKHRFRTAMADEGD